MGVTPEVRLAFDRAMAAFEAEMEAEGRHNWREELRAAAPPTITPIMTEDPGQVDGEDAEDDEGGQHFDEVEQAWQEVRNETLRATLGTDDARTMELRQQVDSLCGSISHMADYRIPRPTAVKVTSHGPRGLDSALNTANGRSKRWGNFKNFLRVASRAVREGRRRKRCGVRRSVAWQRSLPKTPHFSTPCMSECTRNSAGILSP
jgi:hypothetical protein